MNKNRILILYITKVQIYKAQIPGSDSTMQQTNLVNKKIYLSSNLDSVKCIVKLRSRSRSQVRSRSGPRSGPEGPSTPLLNGPLAKNRDQRSGILHIVRDPLGSPKMLLVRSES